MNSTNLPLKPLPIGNIAITALVMGLVAHFLFFDHVPGISFVVFVIAFLGVLFGCMYYYTYRFPRRAVLFIPGILFFAAMVAVRSNGFLTFLNVITTIGLCLLMSEYIMGFNVVRFTLLDYLRVSILSVLGFLGRSFSAFAELVRLKNSIKPIGKGMQVLRGTLVTIPILVLFIILFSSADLVFGRFITSIFSFHLDTVVVARLIFIGIISFLFLGIFAYIFDRVTESVSIIPEKPLSAPANFGVIESSMLLGSLCALFLLFIGIQIEYLFAGQEAITKLGFTYAEYAHKGFAELNIAAVVTFIIVWALQKHVSMQQAKNIIWFKVLVSVLLLETFVILLSGFTRLSLYEAAYGFTSLRLYSHIFIIWLAVVFLLLWYKVLSQNSSSLLTFEGFISILVFLVIINFLNPDAFIARQNIQRYEQSTKLDSYYVSELSPDAAGIFEQYMFSSDQNLKNSALEFFDTQSLRNTHTDWQSYNAAWSRLNAAIEKNSQEIKQYRQSMQSATEQIQEQEKPVQN